MKKAEILEYAQKQLMTGGYDALNFATISKALKTSRTNLHHHFGNKEGLAREATLAFIENSLGFITMMVEKHPADFPGYFAEIDDMFLGNVAQTGQTSTCVCGQLIRGFEVPEALIILSQDFFKQQTDIHAQLIRDSQKSGTIIKDIDADYLADMSMIFLQGMVHMLRASKNPKAYAKEMRGSFSKFLTPYMNN